MLLSQAADTRCRSSSARIMACRGVEGGGGGARVAAVRALGCNLMMCVCRADQWRGAGVAQAHSTTGGARHTHA
jgi:hypothetical protein